MLVSPRAAAHFGRVTFSGRATGTEGHAGRLGSTSTASCVLHSIWHSCQLQILIYWMYNFISRYPNLITYLLYRYMYHGWVLLYTFVINISLYWPMYTYKKLFRYWVIDNQRIAENSRAAVKAQILYIVSLGTIEKQKKKTTEKKKSQFTRTNG